MHPFRFAVVVGVLFVSTNHVQAQGRLPVVDQIKPLGATPGKTVSFTIAGTDLDRASAIVFETDWGRTIRSKIGRAESGKVDVSFALPKELPVGPLAFRLITPRGLSNLGWIDVGRVETTVVEIEPNDGFRKPQAVSTPAVVEGTIRTPSDVDLYAVNMKAGETLVAEVVAARIGSSLDPIVTIFGPDGRELVSDDDRFGLDAAISIRAARSGRHYVQVVDADGRSRDNAIEAKAQNRRFYRINIGSFPLLTTVAPPGGHRGTKLRARLLGVGVPEESTIDLPTDASLGNRPFSVIGSNAVNLRVGDVAEYLEHEPNDRPETANEFVGPCAINGTFQRKAGGDVDAFRIKPIDGRAGDYAISVLSARIGSPADPVLTILGDDAQSVAEDDDKLGRDARIERRIDPKGIVVAVREAFERGGERFVYRIEVEPIARIGITIDLGTRTVPKNGLIDLPVTIDRRGFNGPLTILPGVLPKGLTVATVSIPANVSTGSLTLSASNAADLGLFTPSFVLRDVPYAFSWTYVERRADGAEKGPRPAIESDPYIVVAEPGK